MDMSRVSMTSYPLADRPLDEALSIIAGAGYAKVDLLQKMPHFSPDPSECDLDQVAATARSHSLAIANLATYEGKLLTTGNDDDKAKGLDEIKRLIDCAATLGARSIRVYRVGSPNESLDHIDIVAPVYAEAAKYAAQKQIYMGVENHGGAISGNPKANVDLCEKVGSPYFGVLYDPANLHVAGVDYQQAFEVFKEHVVHVHLKDGKFNGGHDSIKQTMLGEGDIDPATVVRQLSSINYQGDIALEYETEVVPPEKGLKIWYDRFSALEI